MPAQEPPPEGSSSPEFEAALTEPNKFRHRARRALRTYFAKRRSPRFFLALIIILTGLAGLGLSHLMLDFGWTLMAVRYPVSLLGAYALFLILIRLWAAWERRRFRPGDPTLRDAWKSDGRPETSALPGSDSRWWEWLDFSPDIGLDDGCLPALLIGAVVGLGLIIFAAIGAAPVLIAEVFIDVALAGLLYRHLREAAAEHWLGTAIRKTYGHVFGAIILLAIIGYCLDIMAPDSDSIGKALREIYHGPKAPQD